MKPKESRAYPAKYLIEADKGTKEVFSGSLEPGIPKEIDMVSPKSPVSICRTVTLGKIGDVIGLSRYEMAVQDAVNSIYSTGIDTMSMPMIIRVLYGNPDLKPSEKQKTDVLTAVRKLIVTPIDIDYNAETLIYYFDSCADADYHYYGTVISGELITTKISGMEIESCLRIFRQPILSYIAAQKKQILRINTDLIKAPYHMGKEDIVLRDLLLSRIEQCRSFSNSPREALHTIRFDYIYEKLGILPAEYKKRSRTLERVKALLDQWQQAKYIAEYRIRDERIILLFCAADRD